MLLNTVYIYSKLKNMNNLVHIKPLDPIFDEYEAFVDKSAGIKTIAFKYFGADIQKAISYLEIDQDAQISTIETPQLHAVESLEYYQPELLH